MTTFLTATDDMLAKQITAATDRVIFVAPGVSKTVAEALVNPQESCQPVTVILDADEEVCRIGYGEADGLEHLIETDRKIKLRKQSGVRLGLLIADKNVTIWSPTPRAVDGERKSDEPNAVVLKGRIGEDSTVAQGAPNLAGQLARRLDHEHVGEKPIQPDELREVVKELQENPPAPFNLARKVRVFSTKFQYVETELKGAEWTRRRITLSGLLNPDLPDSLRDILETQIRPYRNKSDVHIDVPCIVRGQIAYNKQREKIRIPMSQRDMEGIWKDIRDRYLFRLVGFGTLVRKRDLAKFREEIKAFEYILKDWVAQFRQQVNQDEDNLVCEIVNSIKGRIRQSGREKEFKNIDLDTEVRHGLKKMRIIEPRVRIVIKDVSWESSRDREFTTALRKAVPAEDLKGWFDEFVAVQEKR